MAKRMDKAEALFVHLRTARAPGGEKAPLRIHEAMAIAFPLAFEIAWRGCSSRAIAPLGVAVTGRSTSAFGPCGSILPVGLEPPVLWNWRLVCL